jgi:hypothetical protein
MYVLYCYKVMLTIENTIEKSCAKSAENFTFFSGRASEATVVAIN